MRRSASLLVLMCLLLVSSATAAAGDGGNTWTVPGDFETIQAAIDSDEVMPGDTIRVGPGNFYGAEVTKGVHIKGKGRAVIDDGPLLADTFSTGFWLLEGSDRASFSQLTFNVDLGLYSWDIDEVDVHHCRFNNNFQAITNWGGNYWQIQHNTITDISNGGAGIAIVVRSGRGTEAQYNVVTHNVISGMVTRIDPEDHDISPGIFLGLFDSFPVTGNQILHNKVNLVSAEPDQKQTAGVAFIDYRSEANPDPAACDLLNDNTAAFNDLRGNDHSLYIAPPELADCNSFSKNK